MGSILDVPASVEKARAIAAAAAAYRDFTRVARGAVAFTYDDGFAESMTLADLHDSLGQRATFAVVSDWVDTTGKITSANVLDLYRRGHEISNHTKTHANYTGITAAQRAVESDTCQAFIAGITGELPTTFIYPQGGWDINTERELYTRFRAWGITASATTNLPVPYMLGETIPRFVRVNMDDITNLPRALSLVRMAAVAPVVVSFYTHRVDAGGYMNLSDYRTVAQLAHDLHVPTVLCRDAYGGASRIVNPSFEDGLASWFDVSSNGGAATGVTVTPDTGISGTKALRLTVDGTTTPAQTAGVSQALNVAPGLTTWRVSGRVRRVSGNLITNDFGPRMRYRDNLDAAISTQSLYPTLAASAGTWERFENDFTVPEGTKHALLDMLSTPAATRAGVVEVDHVDIRPKREGGLG